MNRWKLAFAKRLTFNGWLIVAGIALWLAGCGGGNGGSGTTGGGSGNNGPSSGEYLWEAGSDDNLAYATINTTSGALSSPTIASNPAGSSNAYTSLVVSPSGDFIYSFFSSFNELQTFETSGPGLKLAQLKGSNYLETLPHELSMALHPSGQFLYVDQEGVSGTIQEITLNSSSGAMTLGPVVTENTPDMRFGVFDSTGDFYFVFDLTRGVIFVFQVNQKDGTLKEASNSPFTLPGGEQPQWLASGGAGGNQYLYAALYTPGGLALGGIAAFAINDSTGALTVVPGSPFDVTNTAPDVIAVSPSGQFLYGANLSTGDIDGFQVNPATGVLTGIPGSPFPTSPGAETVAIEPLGKYLYLSNYEKSAIYGFGIDSTSGALTPVAGSPFPAVAQPTGMTMMTIP